MKGLINELTGIRKIPEFYEALVANGLLRYDERFISVEMDISSGCNLKCVMCYHSLNKYAKEKSSFITPDMFSRISESLFPYAQSLTLSLGHEPLTSPYFCELLRMSSKYDIPQILFSTNGILLNEGIIDEILSCRVTKVIISIDGAIQKTFESIRRGANYEGLLKNINLLVRKKQAITSPYPIIRVDVVLMKSNIHELEEIVDLAADSGAEEINLSHVVVYKGLAMESESLFHYKDVSNYWLTRALHRAKKRRLSVVSHPEYFILQGEDRGKNERATAGSVQKKLIRFIFSEKARSRPNKLSAFQKSPYCFFPFFHVSLNAAGKILACPFSHGEGAFGSILEDKTFEEIWFGKKFNKLRKHILEKSPPKMCRRCTFLSIHNTDIKKLFEPRKP